MVEAHDLGAVLALFRPTDDGDAVVVIDQATPTPMVRGIARAVLREEERRHLSRFLDLRRKR